MIVHVADSSRKEEVETVLDSRFALRGGVGIVGSEQV